MVTDDDDDHVDDGDDDGDDEDEDYDDDDQSYKPGPCKWKVVTDVKALHMPQVVNTSQ